MFSHSVFSQPNVFSQPPRLQKWQNSPRILREIILDLYAVSPSESFYAQYNIYHDQQQVEEMITPCPEIPG